MIFQGIFCNHISNFQIMSNLLWLILCMLISSYFKKIVSTSELKTSSVGRQKFVILNILDYLRFKELMKMKASILDTPYMLFCHPKLKKFLITLNY